MTFDRLVYIDRLKEAGVAEPVARAHAEALRDALLETVATKADMHDLKSEMVARIEQVDRKIEMTSRDLIIKGADGLALTASPMIGLKLLG